jgi:hypothetical protein
MREVVGVSLYDKTISTRAKAPNEAAAICRSAYEAKEADGGKPVA